MREFKHIEEVWDYLSQYKTLKGLKMAISNIPSRFGSFEIRNEKEYKEDNCFEIINTYYDKNIDDYDYSRRCFVIDEERLDYDNYLQDQLADEMF